MTLRQKLLSSVGQGDRRGAQYIVIQLFTDFRVRHLEHPETRKLLNNNALRTTLAAFCEVGEFEVFLVYRLFHLIQNLLTLYV